MDVVVTSSTVVDLVTVEKVVDVLSPLAAGSLMSNTVEKVTKLVSLSDTIFIAKEIAGGDPLSVEVSDPELGILAINRPELALVAILAVTSEYEA